MFSVLLKEMTFGKFVKKNLHLTKQYITADDLEKDPPQADIYVTGSDQTWNSQYNGGVDRGFFLTFAPKDKAKVSFVASFGKAHLNDKEEMCIRDSVRKDGKTTWMTSLPMLWDVFRGKMSVVGPRPLTKKEMDALIKENPRYFYRLRVQAGLTGYAQVYGKKTSVQEDLLKLDLIYIQHFSALMDMKLMLLSLQGESRQ